MNSWSKKVKVRSPRSLRLKGGIDGTKGGVSEEEKV